MAAGLGFKTFTTGEVLTAADTNGYLMQGVLVFASAAARDAAITSPQEGQCCYLKDTDAVLTYSGAAWVGFDDSNAIQNSIVDAKGDLVAASGADTPARLAVGANGETLVADSAATTGLRYSATPSASNPVLNSAFQIAQRGTSFTVNNAASYVLDRWYVSTNNNSTISQQVTNDDTNLPSIQYCMRVQRTAAATSTATITAYQSFETVNSIPYAGKTVTVSFYARKGANYSATSDRLSVYLITGTGTDQNYAAGYTSPGYPISDATATLTTTWQRFTFTGTLSAATNEMTVWFGHVPTGTAGAADYYEVTGVQVDIGSVALPFRTYAATIQGELAAAQRYYYRWNADTVDAGYGNGFAISTTAAYIQFGLPVPMRVVPTAIEASGIRIANGSNAYTGGTWAITRNHTLSPILAYSGTSGLTANNFYQGNCNSTAHYLGFTAEL